MDFAQALTEIEPLLRRRAARMMDGRYYGSGAPLPQDLAQLTLAQLSTEASTKLLKDKPFEDIRRYAYRALHNAFIDHCTRKRREYSSDDTILALNADDGSSNPEAVAIARDEHTRRVSALDGAMSMLSEEERSFLVACMELGSAPAAQRKLGWPKGGAANACERRGSLLRRLQGSVRAAMLSNDEEKGGTR